MTTYLVSVFNWAESAAEKIIIIKDAALGLVADLIIPLPGTRQRFRQWFKEFLKPISRPLSEKVDYWIDADVITVANVISVTRALTGPVFFTFVMADLGLAYYLVLIAWAGFTDYFDGIIARKMDQQTETGAAIDAGCDKIFAFFAAASFLTELWFWPKVFFFLFDGMLAVLALSLRAAKRHGNYQGQAQVKANWLGKVKYNLQAVTLLCLLFGWPTAGNYCLWAANTFAFGSLIRHLNPKNN